MNYLIDTHSHIYSKDYDEDLAEVIDRASRNNVDKIICVGTDIQTSMQSLEISRAYKNVYCTVGIHPHEAKKTNQTYISDLEKMAKDPKVVAIGESGLDYYYNHSSPDIQKKIFIEQIELAEKLGLPIVIHNRNSNADLIDILKNYKASGVVHCFSGDIILAEKLIDLGFYLSFTGIITFNNSTLTDVIKKIDLDRIMVETDSPYLTPVPFRGKRNEPMHVKIIAEKIAKIKNIDIKTLISHTTNNAFKLFSKME